MNVFRKIIGKPFFIKNEIFINFHIKWIFTQNDFYFYKANFIFGWITSVFKLNIVRLEYSLFNSNITVI